MNKITDTLPYLFFYELYLFVRGKSTKELLQLAIIGFITNFSSLFSQSVPPLRLVQVRSRVFACESSRARLSDAVTKPRISVSIIRITFQGCYYECVRLLFHVIILEISKWRDQ